MRLTRRAVLGSALAGLASGSRIHAAPVGEASGIPRVSISAFPEGAVGVDPGQEWVRLLSAATLLDVSPEGLLVGGLTPARQVDIDRLVYSFTIRLDARFSDATPVTSADVVASLEHARSSSIGTDRAWRWEEVAGISVIDDSSLRIELDHPDASIPPLLASAQVPIHPAAWIDSGWDPEEGPFPPACGCFQVTSAHATTLRLDRNDAFYQVGRPRFPGVTCTAPGTSLSRSTELVAGDVDLLIDAPLLDVPTLREDPSVVLVGGATTRLCYLLPNLGSAFLADVRMRRLLSSAIDRAALVTSAAGGEAIPATSLIAPGHWAGAESLIEKRSPDDVRAELSELGQPAAPTLRLIALDRDPMLANACVFLQEQLAWSGIAISLDLLDEAEMTGVRASGNWDLELRSSPFWLDPHELIRPLVMSDGTANHGGYDNPRVDYLAVLAARSSSLNYRASFYRSIQSILAEDVPVIPLFHPNYYDAMTTRLTGYGWYPPVSAMAMRSAVMPIRPPAR